MADRPKSLIRMDDVDLSLQWINMMVYGHPGEGKTPFWGTGNERLLIMDSDHGFESAAAQGSKASVVSATNYDDVLEVYDWLRVEGHKEYDWVVWDSLTLFQERVLIDEIMVDAVADNPNQDEFVPSMRQYLINMNKLGRYVRDFVDLPMNFGISCHVLNDRDPDGAAVYMPAIQGKGMPSRISGYMNIIGYLGHAQIGEGDGKTTIQRMLTQKVGKFYARDRFQACGLYVDEPTVPKIEALVNAKKAALKKETVAKTPAARTARKAIKRPAQTKE